MYLLRHKKRTSTNTTTLSHRTQSDEVLKNSRILISPLEKMEVLAPRDAEGDHPTESGRSPPTTAEQPILYHDESRYIVVNKPADVRMDGNFNITVEKLIKARIGIDKSTGLRFVQRLDYATSGVLIAGLNRRSTALAGIQFESRTVTKRYRALLHGVPPDFAVWTWRIAYSHPNSFYMCAHPADATEGRTAETIMTVLRRGYYRNARVALVEMRPQTGRRHQLRVHAAKAGFPIVGDATYVKNESPYFGDNFEPHRMMLHAHSLEIQLPPKGVEVRGKRSALKQFIPKRFETECPFSHLPGIVWSDDTSTKTVI